MDLSNDFMTTRRGGRNRPEEASAAADEEEEDEGPSLAAPLSGLLPPLPLPRRVATLTVDMSPS